MAPRAGRASGLEFREEVLNVALAEVLTERGLLSLPETIRLSRGRRRLPDVTLADLWGVRIVIEGRVSGGKPVRTGLVRDATARVEEGIAPICLAVLYPPDLRRAVTPAQLRAALNRTPLAVRVISEGHPGDWDDTTVDGLGDVLRRSYELLVGEDVVTSAVEDLDHSISAASATMLASRATPTRLRGLLGIPDDIEGGRR
jgi:hypothetical protein